VRTIIRAFIRTPDTAPDQSCIAGVPPLHKPSGYPATLAEATPAAVLSGPDPGEDARRAATVAAEAFADAVIRQHYSAGTRGRGLRGGRFTVRGERFTLTGIRFVSDATVDGSGTYRRSTGAVDATLSAGDVTVRVRWTQASPFATATIGASTLLLGAP
jgi:hypothetical protein